MNKIQKLLTLVIAGFAFASKISAQPPDSADSILNAELTRQKLESIIARIKKNGAPHALTEFAKIEPINTPVNLPCIWNAEGTLATKIWVMIPAAKPKRRNDLKRWKAMDPNLRKSLLVLLEQEKGQQGVLGATAAVKLPAAEIASVVFRGDRALRRQAVQFLPPLKCGEFFKPLVRTALLATAKSGR